MPSKSILLLVLATLMGAGCKDQPPRSIPPDQMTTVVYADTFDLFAWQPRGIRPHGGTGSWEITQVGDSITKVRLQLHRKEATYLSFRRDCDRVKYDMEGARELNFSNRFLDLFEKDSSIIYTNQGGMYREHEFLLMDRYLRPVNYAHLFGSPNGGSILSAGQYLAQCDSPLICFKILPKGDSREFRAARDPDSVWAFMQKVQRLPASENVFQPRWEDICDPIFLSNHRVHR